MHMRIQKILLAALLGLMTVAAPALAADLRGDQTVVVERTETIMNNLYAGGRTVAAEGVTEGDAVLAGLHVSSTGTVRDDVAAAGMTVSVTGPVGGDLRAAGRDVSIGSAVGGEAVVFGSSVLVLDAASVAGDLVVFAEDVTINGNVGGNLKVRGSKVVINGRVAGNADVEASQSLSFGSAAAVSGKLNYRNAIPVMMPAGVAAQQYDGAVVMTKAEVANQARHRGGVGEWALNFAFAVATGLVFFLISRRRQESLAAAVGERPWKLAGLGLLVLAALPVTLVLLVVTLIGIPVAMLAVMALVLFTLVAHALVGAVAASLVGRFVPRLAKWPFDWMTVVGGTLALHLVKAVPVLGGLVYTLIFIATLGVLFTASWRALVAWRASR